MDLTDEKIAEILILAIKKDGVCELDYPYEILKTLEEKNLLMIDESVRRYNPNIFGDFAVYKITFHGESFLRKFQMVM